MAELRLRVATPADAPALERLGRDTYVEHFPGIWSPPALARFLDEAFAPHVLAESLASGAQQWLLAFEGDEPAGFSRVNWSRREPVSGVIGAELQKIYFRAAATGRGHGARLLARIIEEAAARRERAVWLDVLATNAAARRFYERHGFSAVGELAFSTDLRKIPLTAMVRRLRE